MGYIIVWRNSYRNPHISLDDHNFKEDYASYPDAVFAAEAMSDEDSFCDYAIYEEVTS